MKNRKKQSNLVKVISDLFKSVKSDKPRPHQPSWMYRNE